MSAIRGLDRGSIVVAGQGSLVSGATSPEAQEAVTAFMKFYTSPDIMFGQTVVTGSYFPVDLSLSEDQQQQLEPLALHVVDESKATSFAYPHAFFAAPAGFSDAWNNLWPAYAKGDLETNEFLTRLGSDATAGATG